ncbi:glycoside hydrolase family 35 protein [Luteolibacter luteus]|uniref:Beta-galactosidase n=1 Tax=Luteolibacter luteus TaxID=2728835 RepID=A0A858RGK8_9BACT|nr:beta-galactosidase family protein [Luteolibacter luteus]QJE95721.1 beta-galactosidase [Luteolibacter luteus]
MSFSWPGGRLCLLLAAIGLASNVVSAGEFEVSGDKFVLDGKPFQIRSGEIHYSRVPASEWRSRIQMARAMGLNTICTYVFWNYHETKKGEFDFSGEKDVAQFIRICGEEGMKAIVRPGPYVCAEWDLGGIPAWILAERGVKLRTTDPRYLEPAKAWMKKMGAMIEPFTAAKGGPVIMVQLENEYGNTIKNDRQYLLDLQTAIRGGGYTGMLFTCDSAFPEALTKGSIPGLVKAVNFGDRAENAFRQLETANPGQPSFTAEFWVGWFDQWQRGHMRGDTRQKSAELAWMMEKGASFNLYMFHGGSTRGMWAGANFESRYYPTTCGYDYDAPLDESGRPTAKYNAFRQIIGNRLKDEKLPELPVMKPAGSVGSIQLDEVADLSSAITTTKCEDALPSMEEAGLGNGFILYRGNVEGPVETTLDLGKVKDRVYVMVDGGLIGIGGRSTQTGGVPMKIDAGNHQIDFLVENMGRVNYGSMDEERKGLEAMPDLGGATFSNVSYGLVPATSPPAANFTKSGEETPPKGITLRKGKFKLDTPVDTWLDMSGFGRGVVWLNGRNLGRYWSAGPSQTIFIPAAWQRTGEENELIVLELETSASPDLVRTSSHQIWETPVR